MYVLLQISSFIVNKPSVRIRKLGVKVTILAVTFEVRLQKRSPDWAVPWDKVSIFPRLCGSEQLQRLLGTQHPARLFHVP